MRFLRGGSVAAAAASMLIGGPASAQINFFDDFEADAPALNQTEFVNWDVSNGSVDLYNPYAALGNSVDLDGSSGDAGTFSTKTAFSLLPGSYTLRFELGKNGGNLETMTVSLGTAFSEVFSDASSYASPVAIVRNFVLTSSAGSASLVFDHAGGDNEGYVIDNVRLTSVAPAADGVIPEPGTIALVASGLLPLAGAAVRRRKA